MPNSLLTYRRIDPVADGDLAYAHYRETAIASFGDGDRCSSQQSYLRWLSNRIQEYPDGHAFAALPDGRVIGQLELQVPYGLSIGYVNLFYVARAWRRLGLGRRLHQEYVDRYFQSWDADTIELHVAPRNHAAIQFYRSLGYTLSSTETDGTRMWRMQRQLARTAAR